MTTATNPTTAGVIYSAAAWNFPLVAVDLAAIVQSGLGDTELTEQPKPAFVPAVVVRAAASPNVLPSPAATPASGRMVIDLGNDRRIIVDAGASETSIPPNLALHC